MGTFDDALRERLDAIDARGTAQTTWEKLQAARRQQMEAQNQSLAQQRAAWQSQIAQQQNQQNFGSNFSNSNDAFSAFKNAIGMKESNNNYGAVNRSSGALGKYQIMPSNLKGTGRGWDYETLGYDVSTSEFLHSPQIQEKIAGAKLQQYYNKYGPAGASIAWYAGPSAANRYVNSGSVSNSIQPGGYPSVYAYMQAILRQAGYG